MKEIKSIFFGLYESLGDIVLSSTIIRAIRKKYPNAKITYCVGQAYVDVLENNADINEVIGASHQHEIILRSADKEYDKVFLPLMTTHEDTIWHQTSPWCVSNGDNHNLMDWYAQRCNDDLVLEDRKHYIYPQQKHWDEIVAKIDPKDKEYFETTPYITIHTTTRNTSKDWKYEYWVELAKRIKEKYGKKFEIYQVGMNDKPLPLPVIPVMGLPILNTAALIKRSRLQIDVDSGTHYISDALNVPTICIMGATNPNMAGATGGNVTFVEPPVRECIGTATHCVCARECIINKPCINLVTVDDVFHVVCDKLDPIFGE